MKLATLHPRLDWVAADELLELSFDCPKCEGRRIVVRCRVSGPASFGVWIIVRPPEPSSDGWNDVTLTPSIRNDVHGRDPCGYHCALVDGELRAL